VTRRAFIMLLGGGAAAWPLAAHAQQSAKPPAVGYLSSFPPDINPKLTEAFRRAVLDHLSSVGGCTGRAPL
jgi:hypothetical protein